MAFGLEARRWATRLKHNQRHHSPFYYSDLCYPKTRAFSIVSSPSRPLCNLGANPARFRTQIRASSDSTNRHLLLRILLFLPHLWWDDITTNCAAPTSILHPIMHTSRCSVLHILQRVAAITWCYFALGHCYQTFLL